MSSALPTLESLKNEAKSYLRALRAKSADAIARFERALHQQPENATLRDVQHALAREHGFAGWSELKLAVDADAAARFSAAAESLAKYEEMVAVLLDAYRTGTPAAMERHYAFTWHRREWSVMRTYAQLDVGKRPAKPGDDVELTTDDARYLVAREHHFESWAALAKFAASGQFRPRSQPEGEVAAEPIPDSEVTELNFSWSQDFDDDSMRELTRYPKLKALDLSHTAITDRALAMLRDLPAIEKLSLDGTRITPAGLVALHNIPSLNRLSLDATDEWMPHLAALPYLRFLAIQDTPASDDGWTALSKSETIESIWGRRCHNLESRGFLALGTMPALTNLAVSCLNVHEDAIAALPTFPALRELMPMDIPDALYHHIGRCENLERLVLMYCRDTTDAATEQITSLKKLTYYFNSYTTITDRTPELLSTMESLERITLDACHWITEAGVTALLTLPNLRELNVAGRQLAQPQKRR